MPVENYNGIMTSLEADIQQVLHLLKENGESSHTGAAAAIAITIKILETPPESRPAPAPASTKTITSFFQLRFSLAVTAVTTYASVSAVTAVTTYASVINATIDVHGYVYAIYIVPNYGKLIWVRIGRRRRTATAFTSVYIPYKGAQIDPRVHADLRTSLGCHILEDIIATLEGRPLPGDPPRAEVKPLLEAYRIKALGLRRRVAAATAGHNLDDEEALSPAVALPSGPPLPSVLGANRIGVRTPPEDLNCQQSFEGSGTKGVPPRLCLPVYNDQALDNARPFLVSYDINSILGFASLCAIAKQGMRWFPAINVQMNITSNIHLGIPVPPPTTEPDPTWQVQPLHQIPHYALGQISGWDSMLIFVIFPRLYKHPLPRQEGPPPERTGNGVPDEADAEGEVYSHINVDGEHPDVADDEAGATARAYPPRHRSGKESILLSDQIRLWVDRVFLPALYKAVVVSRRERRDAVVDGNEAWNATAADANILQHIPQSYQAAVQLTKARMEATGTKQHDKGRYQNFFLNAKNTKVEFMRSGSGNGPLAFPHVMEDFQSRWHQTFDRRYYEDTDMWVDIGKQVTALDTDLPGMQPLPTDFQAETYLWRQCCLEHVVQERKDWLRACQEDARQLQEALDDDPVHEEEQRRPGRPPTGYKMPAVAWYPWAMVDGPPVYENLALDPLYLRQLRQGGRATIVNPAVAKAGYILGKNRVALNLEETTARSFGIRSEDRITLALLAQLVTHWDEVDCEYDIQEAQVVVESRAIAGGDTPHISKDGEGDCPLAVALPWYAVPSSQVTRFLAAQINRHCLMFEHILSQADVMFSIEETVPIVIALRNLRYCYSSNLLHKEPLLFRDNWAQDE
ncbi:hypothetical protein SCUP234_08619 [Seiridium cupressi]